MTIERINQCDPDVVAIARSFLEDENMDSDENVRRVATAIQAAIEDEIAALHDELEPKGDPPEPLSDEEHAKIEEDRERVRDAKTGFPDD